MPSYQLPPSSSQSVYGGNNYNNNNNSNVGGGWAGPSGLVAPLANMAVNMMGSMGMGMGQGQSPRPPPSATSDPRVKDALELCAFAMAAMKVY
jgi:hypothetical protein